jgi:hypothetical protein
MGYEQKDNSGSLFKNDRKEKETHPDAKGSALIDGVAYWMSAWTKQDKNGNRYQSFSFQRKDQPAASKPAARKSVADDMDDTIPF